MLSYGGGQGTQLATEDKGYLMQDAVMKEAAVMIIDGVDSAAIASTLGPKAYDAHYLQSLHRCYRSILSSFKVVPQVPEDRVLELPSPRYVLNKTCFAHWAGDEFCVALCSDRPGDDAMTALWMATETLMRWYLREPNLKRLREGSEPYHLSCGIHAGPIILAHRRSLDEEQHWKPEGIAFAYAKRAQSESGRGIHTRVFITQEAERHRKSIEQALYKHAEKSRPFYKWETEDRGHRMLKGLGQKRLYEVKWFVPPGFVVNPDRYDAAYSLFTKYPIQPALAWCMWQKLLKGDVRRPVLAECFKSTGIHFETRENKTRKFRRPRRKTK